MPGDFPLLTKEQAKEVIGIAVAAARHAALTQRNFVLNCGKVVDFLQIDRDRADGVIRELCRMTEAQSAAESACLKALTEDTTHA